MLHMCENTGETSLKHYGVPCVSLQFHLLYDDHNHEIVLEYCIVHGGRILNTPSLLYYYDKKHEGS